MKKFSIINFLVCLIIASFIGSGTVSYFEMENPVLNSAVISFIALAAMVIPFERPSQALFAITPEVWAKDIEENIYPESSFFLQSRDDSEFLEGNKIHLPQSGTAPNVEKNRSVLPAVAAKREDSDIDYSIHEFTTDPVILQRTEEIEASYNKRQSLMFDHFQTLTQEIADMFLTEWAPSLAANFARTTGGSRAAYKSGQTGNRKAVAKNDLIELNRLMNRMDIPQEGRILLIDSDLMADVLKIEEFVSLEKIGNAALVKGSVGRLLNFNVMVRSAVLRYDNTGTPVVRAQGSSVAAADNLAALAWHPQFLRRCLGTTGNNGIEVFEKNKDPQFYGDVFSALVRAGASKARNDQKGVLSLIEAAA